MNDSKNTISRRQFGSLAIGSAAISTLLGSSSHLLSQDKTTPDTESTTTPNIPKGLFSTKFGAYQIHAIMDGIIPMRRSLFSGDDQKIKEVLNNSGQSAEIIPSPISAFLFKSEKKTILIDAGLGNKPGFGNLTTGLLATHTRPEDIDTLIITHAHPDHIGGITDAKGKAIYPNAELIIAEEEVKFWTDPAVLAAIPEKRRGAFHIAKNAITTYGDQVTQIASGKNGKEITPGITMKLAAGHTPGHSILHIDGDDGKELLMIADTLHNTELHCSIPDIKFVFDVDPTQAALTRRKIFDQLTIDKSLALCSHAHFPGLGRILKHKDVYRYSAASLI